MKAYEIHIVNLPKKGLGHPPPPLLFRQTSSPLEKKMSGSACMTHKPAGHHIPWRLYLHGIYLRICHLKCKVSLHKLSQIINEMI